MEALELINILTAVLFTLCYTYQFIYIPISWFKKRADDVKPTALHRYAVLICARNEQEVIGDLIDSIKRQSYPAELISIFVMADNCTDRTAETAKKAGAFVYTRSDKVLIGKGYALEALLKQLKNDYPNSFDGYFVFDADNILSPDYIEQMNRTFSQGHDIITSYRNSKNYGSCWISAGYALWFLRESRYLNYPRYIMGTSCAVSGTGFLFSKAVAEEIGGWPYHMLTEDIEFSADQITNGRKVAFCKQAVLYDEQPISFKQSWHQRMRWSRGFLQVFRGYGMKLVKGIFKGSFSCFDMTMTVMPAFILSTVSVICNIAGGVTAAVTGNDTTEIIRSVIKLMSDMYFTLFLIGAITTVTEWRHIHTTSFKKVLYTFTFPIFMATYIPISFVSLICKTTWKPIRHTMSLKSMKKDGNSFF